MRANGTDAQTIKMQATLRRNSVAPWSYRTHITRCMRFAPLTQMLAIACTSHTPIPLDKIAPQKF